MYDHLNAMLSEQEQKESYWKLREKMAARTKGEAKGKPRGEVERRNGGKKAKGQTERGNGGKKAKGEVKGGGGGAGKGASSRVERSNERQR